MHMVTLHTVDINLLKIHVEHIESQTFVLYKKKAWGENELQITNLSPNYTRSNSTQRNLCTA